MIDGGLRPTFREKLPDFHWVTIETGGTGRGIPDSEYCGDGASGWVEFKQTDGYVVTLSPQQIAWHCRRSRAGGRSYVAVRRHHKGGPRRGPPVDELWLLRGGAAKQMVERGLSETESYVLGLWRGGAASWDWDAIRKILS